MALRGHFFREFEEDPFFRDAPGGGFPVGFVDPFQSMFAPRRLGAAGTSPLPSSHELAIRRDPFAGMWPFGSPFMGAHSMLGNMQQQMMMMQPPSGSHSFCSSSVMHYSSTGGEGGRPRVYHATSSTRQAGGLKETRRSVQDSESGVQKMSIGHHIGERSHTVQRQFNTKTKEQEEHQEFINLDETDAPHFNREWEAKTQPYNQVLSHRSLGYHHGRGHHADTRGLPSFPTTEPEASSSNRHATGSKRKHRPPSLSEQGASMGDVPNRQKHFCHYRSPSPPPPVAPTTTTMHTRPSVPAGSRRRPVPKEAGPSLPRAEEYTWTEAQRKVGRGKSTRVHFEDPPQ